MRSWGTFLGILMGYGFISPDRQLCPIDRRKEAEKKMLQCIRVTLLASLHGYAPRSSPVEIFGS